MKPLLNCCATSILPVEAEVFGPPLTFPSPFGVINLYGQFNLAYQSFDDGATTTDGIGDNGNWNSRLGFLLGCRFAF